MLIIRLWDVQVHAHSRPFQLGFHLDHTDPSLTLHLPFLTVAFGRLKQSGFRRPVIDTFSWGDDIVPGAFFPSGYLRRLREQGCCICRAPVFDFRLLVPRDMGGTWRHAIGLCKRCSKYQGRGWKFLQQQTGCGFNFLMHQAAQTAREFEATQRGDGGHGI